MPILPFLVAATALQAAASPPVPLSSRPGQVIAWDALPPVPYRVEPALQSDMHAFVQGEVKAGRCKPIPAVRVAGGIVVDVAMLVTPEAGPRLTIPRAIDCPTVEQYAAGLVLSFTRNNMPARAALVPQWYRATLRFRWPD
jgi:hypothetical protein